MAGLEIQKLRKQFGEVVALNNLDLSIRSGEFVSFLGPSGCGKTTALRIIAGFETPTSGRVLVDGKDITNVPANRRDMGMVFQAYSLFPNMDVRNNVAFGLRMRRQDKDTRLRRADELLELVGLSEHADRYPHQLSGGQAQRVAIARALAVEPRILVLDEPTSALDVSVRAEVMNLLVRLQDELGLSYVFISHDLGMVRHISDEIDVMYLGRVVERGPYDRVLDHPLHPYTRALAAAVPVPDPALAQQARGEAIGEQTMAEVAAGCPYRPRCPLAEPVCAEVDPPLLELEPGHWAACHVAARRTAGRGAEAAAARRR